MLFFFTLRVILRLLRRLALQYPLPLKLLLMNDNILRPLPLSLSNHLLVVKLDLSHQRVFLRLLLSVVCFSLTFHLIVLLTVWQFIDATD